MRKHILIAFVAVFVASVAQPQTTEPNPSATEPGLIAGGGKAVTRTFDSQSPTKPAALGESAGREQKPAIPPPERWSLDKVKPVPATAWKPDPPRRSISLPKVIVGLVMVGAGAAMLAKAPPASHSQELRGGGSIPCIAITTPIGGGSSTTRDTTCHYEDVKYYSNMYKGGWMTLGTGAAVTIWGLVPHKK